MDKKIRTIGCAATVAFVAAVAFSFFACAPKRSEAKRIDIISYKNWERTTETELDFPIPGHESHYRRIFINKIGSDYRKTGNRSAYPDGTIIVKEIFEGLDIPKTDETPISLDIMVKDENAVDARGGWRWIISDPRKGVETVFTGDFCANCHTEASRPHPYGDRNKTSENRDYLFY